MIRTKEQSDYEIRARDLNRLVSRTFDVDVNESEILNFMEETNYKAYNIRDKVNAGGTFKYGVEPQDVLREIKGYKKFSLAESLQEADKQLILQGDIEIDRNFNIRASLSDIAGISNRIAMQQPKYNIFNINLAEDKLPYICGLDRVIDYICQHELIDMVVEFSYFNIPVGIKHENIIIWELRNY